MDIKAVQNVLDGSRAPGFRLQQIKDAVFRHLVSDWDGVMTLPAPLRETLKGSVPFSSVTSLRTEGSLSDGTVKFAFSLHDGAVIETVLMPHGDGRRTACVSSQAGCPMACAFCATGQGGFRRDLTEAEIVDQVLTVARHLKPSGERITNIVVMGMGEPFNNYDNVMGALKTLNDQEGFALGARRISVSTCGVVSGIRRFMDEPYQFNLAISLHAADDDTRSRIMPVNRVYPISELMPEVHLYAERTGRKVMFEYLLLEGVNDSHEDAQDLADLMTHPLFHVNLIKYHDTGRFRPSSREVRDAFMRTLQERGVSVTHRLSFGEDILAACGQLAGAK